MKHRGAEVTIDAQIAYWDRVAATRTFTHPLHLPWLDAVGRDAAVLDYGCGYGRTLGVLAQVGFDNLAGVDSSPQMIDRARVRHPALQFAVLDSPPSLSLADASVDLVLLFAVLTCVPGDEAQRALVGELGRVLKRGGMLYVSDLLLQTDERNRVRYAEFRQSPGVYGVFETGDGAVCRHHSRAWLLALLANFTIAATRDITVGTMNGNEAAGIQILARRAAGHG